MVVNTYIERILTEISRRIRKMVIVMEDKRIFLCVLLKKNPTSSIFFRIIYQTSNWTLLIMASFRLASDSPFQAVGDPGI